MKSNAKIPTMLNAAYDKDEISFLVEQAKFRDALVKAVDAEDFQALCAVAQDLLAQKEIVAAPTNSATVQTAAMDASA